MSHKFLNTLLAGCARSLGIRLLATIITFVIFACSIGCGLLAVPLLAAQGVADPDLGGLIVGAVVFLVLLFGGGAVTFAWVLGRRANQLDEAFEPLGLEGSMYVISGRRYEGMLDGRQVEALFSRGPHLDLSVEAATGTRLAVGTRTGLGTALGHILQRETLALDDPAFGERVASAHDEAWARALLNDAEARATIVQLTEDVGPTEMRVLLVLPEAIRLKLSFTHTGRILEPNVRAWFDGLLALARIAEGLPAPATPLEGRAWESVEERPRLQRRVMWITAAVVGGFMVLSCVAIAALAGALILLDK